ncbi:Small ubiquitin-related modifier [Quillaja saponaria]|uniref:Small ubiquitin-related modifier n=1 Tax=Quillaja saponaria TaxID=32244 RepID=A0AAD7L2Q1_QUISA|nr:Small ubiquitin-related modifier [Quillaja saponaria]
MHLGKLMNLYCDRQSVNSIAFLFHGESLGEEQTAEELKMEDGDEINAMHHLTEELLTRRILINMQEAQWIAGMYDRFRINILQKEAALKNEAALKAQTKSLNKELDTVKEKLLKIKEQIKQLTMKLEEVSSHANHKKGPRSSRTECRRFREM